MKKLMFLLILVLIFQSVFPQETGTLTDPRDGKIYKTVKIGLQWVMAQNLAYKPETGVYWGNIGEMAKNKIDSTYLEEYFEKYGYLYDFKTANSITIPGWHVPSKDEWKALCKSLGGKPKKVYSALIDGGSSGFNALLSGMGVLSITYQKGISGVGETAGIWSSSRFGIKGINIGFTPPSRFNSGFIGIGVPMGQGLNVRLFKDN
jgi:uncharacterized protein (TIGR02145 family)